MRVITIDNGNTNPHVGIFVDKKLTAVVPLKSFVPKENDILIASDVGTPHHLPLSIDLKTKRHTQSNPYFLDMPVHYAETLGDDRLFSAYYVFKKHLQENEKILLIDAGTFITMDVITSRGFEGGFIFPGLKTFLSAYGKGANLPVLNNREQIKKDLPHTTDEAILGAKEIYLDSILKGIVQLTMPSKIFITGGAGELIERKLSDLNLKVQLESDPHLIHSALFLLQQSLLPQASV